MIVKNTIIGLIVSAIFLSTVAAAGFATFKGKDEEENQQEYTMKIEYDDAGNVRMDMPDQKNGYTLVTGGKAYMVTYQDGKPMVMDMAQFGQMMKGAEGEDDNAGDFMERFVSAKKTSKNRTVAGYKGNIYLIKWENDEGVHEDMVVLSNNRDVVEFSNAMMTMSEIMMSVVTDATDSKYSVQDYLQDEGKGLLAMGDSFQVIKIKHKSMDPKRFKLPAKPMQMPMFGQMPRGAEPQPEKSEKNAATNEYERQKQRQKDKAKNKSQKRVDKTIDKAVDKVLDKLF